MSHMKLGLGLYRHMLDEAHFRFAQQCGCTHLVVHLVDYYTKETGIVPATDARRNYGTSALHDDIWSVKRLRALVRLAADHGLCIHAIENFSPSDWHDVLLAGPQRDRQLEYLKGLIRNVGACGIPAIGYNFSLAGVWGHQRRNLARGGAESASFDADALDLSAPIPDGQVWNMTYRQDGTGFVPTLTQDELWDRLAYFLRAVLPVAEEAGVDLALHPDDPPLPSLRGTPRLVYRAEFYQRLIDLAPSPRNRLEMCLGTIQEMQGMGVYEAIERYAGQGKISYVHVRNVRGKVPRYDEVFIDEGDIDVPRALALLDRHGFDGVLIPDHTPLMASGAPWHTGMAYALGYLKAALQHLGRDNP